MRWIAAALILVGCLFIAGCGLAIDLYDGPPRSDVELAIIETGWRCSDPECIRMIRIAGQDEAIFLPGQGGTHPEIGRAADVTKFRLAPGKYEFHLRYQRVWGAPSFAVEQGEVNLQAGQTYKVFGVQGGCCPADGPSYVWMEDAIGEVLLGESPPLLRGMTFGRIRSAIGEVLLGEKECVDTYLFLEAPRPTLWQLALLRTVPARLSLTDHA